MSLWIFCLDQTGTVQGSEPGAVDLRKRVNGIPLPRLYPINIAAASQRRLARVFPQS
jgi:hypothetical protein